MFIDEGSVNMRFLKKVLCASLAASMSLSLMACGDDKKSGSDNKESMVEEAKENVSDSIYQEDGGFKISGIIGEEREFVASNGNIYISALETEAPTATDADSEFDGVNMDGAVSRIYKVSSDGGNAEMIHESTKGEYEYIEKLGVGADGVIYALINTGENYKMCKYDENGESEVGDATSFMDAEGGSADAFVVDKEGNFIFQYAESLKVADSSLNEKSSCNSENMIESIGLDSNGDVVVATIEYSEDYESNEISARKVDVNTGKLSDKHKMDTSTLSWENQLIKGDGGYDFFFMTGSALYGYNFDGDKTTKVADFNASSINGSYIHLCWMDGIKTFYVSEYDPTTYDYIPGVKKFNKVDPSDYENKKVLTLVTIYGSANLTQAAIDYNNSQTENMVQVIDYTDSSDPEGKFSADIAAGVKPDFLDVTPGVSDISINQYISKGMLEDLTPYIEEDEDVSASDILPTVYEAMKIDGKVYFVSPSTYIHTLVGKSSEIGSEYGWSYGEFKDYITSKPEGTRLFDSSNKMDNLSSFYGPICSDFIDWKKGECHFDSQEFKDLLEVCNIGSNEEMDWENTSSREEGIAKGEQLFVQGSLTAEDVSWDNQVFENDASYKGFPSMDQSGGRFEFSNAIAMTSDCSDKEAAWDFMKYLISEEYQGKYLQNLYAVPTRSDVFEEYLNCLTATKDGTDKYGNKIKVRNNSVDFDGVSIKIKPLTNEEIDTYKKMIENSKGIWEPDKKVLDIVKEEAAAYFAGDKSVDDVCKVIQDRVTTYVNESK